MKLLHVIATMDPSRGRPCQDLRNCIPEFEKRNISMEVVCLDDPGSGYLGKDDFPIHALGRGKTAWQYNAKLIPWLLENICRFDKVIINGLWLYHGYAVRTVLRQLRSEGNVSIPELYVIPHEIRKSPHSKWETVRHFIYWKLIEHKIIKQARAVLFTSEAEKDLARSSFTPYMPNKEIHIGYGTAPAQKYTTSMRQAFLHCCPGIGNDPYLLFLSSTYHKKEVDTLIKAYLKVFKKPMNTEKMLQLAISSPSMDSQAGERLKRMVEKNKCVKGRIHFTGILTGDAKWGALHGCEGFILSSHKENPAIAEAMSCGKPVLISNKISTWKEIQKAKAGYVAENTTEGREELLERWLLMRAEEKIAFGEKAAHLYEKNYTIKVAADNLLNALSKRKLPELVA